MATGLAVGAIPSLTEIALSNDFMESRWLELAGKWLAGKEGTQESSAGKSGLLFAPGNRFAGKAEIKTQPKCCGEVRGGAPPRGACLGGACKPVQVHFQIIIRNKCFWVPRISAR